MALKLKLQIHRVCLRCRSDWLLKYEPIISSENINPCRCPNFIIPKIAVVFFGAIYHELILEHNGNVYPKDYIMDYADF